MMVRILKPLLFALLLSIAWDVEAGTLIDVVCEDGNTRQYYVASGDAVTTQHIVHECCVVERND